MKLQISYGLLSEKMKFYTVQFFLHNGLDLYISICNMDAKQNKITKKYNFSCNNDLTDSI